MKISSAPLVGVPARLPKVTAELSGSAISKHVVSDQPLRSPIYRVNLGAVSPSGSERESDKALEVVRAVSGLVASQFGAKVKLANSVIWLSLDAFKLHGTLADPGASSSEKLAESGHFAASLVDGIGLAVGSENLGTAATALHFVIDAGESVTAGKVVLTQADIATELGIEGAEVLKITELLSS